MLRSITIRAILACVLMSAATAGQTTTPVLIDFGTPQYLSAGIGERQWNDVEPGRQGTPLALVDVLGRPTPAVLGFAAGATFQAANSAGTTTTLPGSPYASLGFPASVTRDVMYGSNGAVVRMRIDGLSTTALYDFVFTASRMGVADVRTTDYTVRGFNGQTVTLDASNNVSAIAQVTGVLPDAGGGIGIEVQAAASNTNAGTHYFYLGGMRITGTETGRTPAVLGFAQSLFDVSRKPGSPPLSLSTTVAASTGATPAVALTAVDLTTGQAPTWLSAPTAVSAGTPFGISIDGGSLPLGEYQARVTARAAGYLAGDLQVRLTVRDPRRLNLLFYGNSYSQGNGTVPAMVADLAEEAGEPAPFVTAALVGGQTLQYHRTNPAQVAAIQALPTGEEWDFVVMQGHSLDATRLGNGPERFRREAVLIVQNVRQHSPRARAVLYQTWARGPGHSFYPGTFSGPLEMHREIHDNYKLAVRDIDGVYGAGTAERAAAGDAVALLAFDPSLYTADLSHPTVPTTFLASAAVFEAIWGLRVCDLAPDFSGSSPLVSRLTGMGFGAADWQTYAGIAERVAPRGVRRFAGSDEDLLLRSGTSAAITACPLLTIAPPGRYRVELTSPNGVHAGVPAALLLTPVSTIAPPLAYPLYPELWSGVAGTYVLGASPSLGPMLAGAFDVPPAVPGFGVLLQGVALSASTELQNPLFSVTDAHLLQVP